VRIVPWPSRSQRRAAVATAEGRAAGARRRAEEAAVLSADLRQMSADAADDRFAELLQAAITGRPPEQEGNGRAV
jgi:hypothetical protein